MLALCPAACGGDPGSGDDETCHEEVAGFDWLFRAWGTVPVNDIWVGADEYGTIRVRTARDDGSVAGLNRPGRFGENALSDGPLAGLWGDDEAGRLSVIGENGAMFENPLETSAVWETRPTIPTSATLKALMGSGGGELWAVGTDGLVAHFDGASWSTETHGNGVLEDVYVRGDEVWIVGVAGASRRNSDGSFEDLGPGTTALHGVFGLPSGELWVVGDGGAWLAWNGTNWDEISTPTESSLRAVWADPAEGVWAGGDDGALLQLSYGTATAVAATIPGITEGLHITSLHGTRDRLSGSLEVWAGTAEGNVLSGGESVSTICE